MFNENIEKKKSLVDQEVAAYKAGKIAAVDVEAAELRVKLINKVAETAKECVKQIGDDECEFHSAQEDKGIKLAELDAKIEFKKGIIDNADKLKRDNEELKVLAETNRAAAVAKDLVIKALETQVKTFDDLIKVVIGKLSKVDVDKLAVNVGVKECK